MKTCDKETPADKSLNPLTATQTEAKPFSFQIWTAPFPQTMLSMSAAPAWLYGCLWRLRSQLLRQNLNSHKPGSSSRSFYLSQSSTEVTGSISSCGFWCQTEQKASGKGAECYKKAFIYTTEAGLRQNTKLRSLETLFKQTVQIKGI